MKKTVFLIVIELLITFSLASYTFNDLAKKELNKLHKISFINENISEVNNYLSSLENNSFIEELPAQESFTIKINILLTKMNTITDEQDLKQLVSQMKLLNDELYDFYKNTEDFSVEFLTASGDLLSRLLNYVSGREMYKMSNNAKVLYQKAIKTNSKYALAYTGYANWFYFAPAVAGGGYKEALKQFTKAVAKSSEEIDLYINLIYRSQTYLKLGNKKACKKDLESAHAIFPEEKLVSEIRRLNEKGRYFLD